MSCPGIRRHGAGVAAVDAEGAITRDRPCQAVRRAASCAVAPPGVDEREPPSNATEYAEMESVAALVVYYEMPAARRGRPAGRAPAVCSSDAVIVANGSR